MMTPLLKHVSFSWSRRRVAPMLYGLAAMFQASVSWAAETTAAYQDSVSLLPSDPTALAKISAISAALSAAAACFCIYRSSLQKVKKLEENENEIFKNFDNIKKEQEKFLKIITNKAAEVDKNLNEILNTEIKSAKKDIEYLKKETDDIFIKNESVSEKIKECESYIDSFVRIPEIESALQSIQAQLSGVVGDVRAAQSNVQTMQQSFADSTVTFDERIREIEIKITSQTIRLDVVETNVKVVEPEPAKPKFLRPEQVDNLSSIVGTIKAEDQQRLLSVNKDDCNDLLSLVHDIGFHDGMTETYANDVETWLRNVTKERRVSLIRPRLKRRYVEFQHRVMGRRQDDEGGEEERVVEIMKYGLAVGDVIVRPAEVITAA